MFIFEITTPGTWLDYKDREWSWQIEGLLRHLESQFVEANAALNLFIDARSTPRRQADESSQEQGRQRQSEIRKQVERELGVGCFQERWDEVNFETDIRFKREKWSQGHIPWEIEHARPFIYAKAFLYALDAFDKFLGVLSREPNVPPPLAALHSEVAVIFPNLRGVRDTAQHPEDRARGLGKRKPLDLKPIENDTISAPNGGVLILNSLIDSKYGSTMTDGHYGEVDISPESMQHLQRILQTVLQTFQWCGPKRHSPSV